MSLLERQIRTILKVYPHAEIVIIGGFESHKIRNELWGDFPVRIICNHLYAETNVTYSVSLGLDASLPGPTLILHGDLVFNPATITGLAGEDSSLLVDPSNQLSDDEVGIGQQDGVVTTLSYALPSKWGQMAYLRGKELELFKHVIRTHRLSNQWLLYEALNHVMNNGGQFVAFQPSSGVLFEVDRYEDLEKAKKI
jgi:choline kinase